MLAWHPHTRQAHLVASGFFYSDGIAVSEDGSYLLVVETDAFRVVKLWLTGDKVWAYTHMGVGDSYAGGRANIRSICFQHTSVRTFVCACVCLLPVAASLTQAGQREIIIHSLPGLPAGLSKASDGNFWLSMTVPTPTVTKCVCWCVCWLHEEGERGHKLSGLQFVMPNECACICLLRQLTKHHMTPVHL